LSRIGKWKRLLLFMFAAFAVCLCGTGCCIRNAWSIGDRTTTLDDRYYEYSANKSEFTYTCLRKTTLSLPFFLTRAIYEPFEMHVNPDSVREDMIPVILEKEPYATYSHMQRKSRDGTKTANRFEVADLIRDGKDVDAQTISAESGVRPGDTIRLRIAPEDYPVLSEPCLIELGYPPMDNRLTTGFDFGYYYCLVFPQPQTADGSRCEMLAYPEVSRFDEQVQRDIIKENEQLRDSCNPLWYGACVLLTPVAIVGDVLLLPYYIPAGIVMIATGGHPYIIF